MHAAVVSTFGEPPQYLPFADPLPASGCDVVDVLAAGLHPRVRSGAAGAHYSSSGVLPMVPGVDGVGRRADGTLAYFVAADDVLGTMAQRAVLDPHRSIELPPGVDVLAVAAAMNPAMSSWVALRHRVRLQPGQSVLVLGATGNAGVAAIQVAKHLGAGHVVAAGRDRTRLDRAAALGADQVASLEDDDTLGSAAADVDIVLDYLWGPPAEHTIMTLLTRRADRSRALDWIQIGAVAGPTAALPSVALRSANLRILGVGQGSVAPGAYAAELPSLVEAIQHGIITVQARPVPLADVERVWNIPDIPGERTVLVP